MKLHWAGSFRTCSTKLSSKFFRNFGFYQNPGLGCISCVMLSVYVKLNSPIRPRTASELFHRLPHHFRTHRPLGLGASNWLCMSLLTSGLKRVHFSFPCLPPLEAGCPSYSEDRVKEGVKHLKVFLIVFPMTIKECRFLFPSFWYYFKKHFLLSFIEADSLSSLS